MTGNERKNTNDWKKLDKPALTDAVYNMDWEYQKFLRNMQTIQNLKESMITISPIRQKC